MKIGIIGAGNWGKNLVKNFSELGVLYAVADTVEINRAWVSDNYPNINLYDDAEQLFSVKELDAVAIATPPHTHYIIAKQAMELGLDVFVEKPLTLDPVEAESLAQIAEKEKRILMVGHLLLYQPAISFIKEYIDSGKLGRVYTLAQRRSKLGRVRSVENVLWSFGVHDIAVILYLVGSPPTDVQVSGHCGIQDNIEDDTYLHLNFSTEIKAHLHNSWLWPRVERSLIVTGELGILEYDEINQRVILHQKMIDKNLNIVDNGQDEIFSGTANPLRTELEHFRDCCLARNSPISNGDNGVDVVRVLAKAEKALSESRALYENQ